MNRDQLIAELKLCIEPLLPGYLAIFDLADTKRRNLYLGHEEVDKDILEFNTLLKTHLGETFKRIGGDRWVAFVTENQLNVFDRLILAYKKEVPISAGWECRAIAPNSILVHIADKTDVLISRAVRCGYLNIQDINDVAARVNYLVEEIWHLPVNLAISLEQELTFNQPKWKCIIGNLPSTAYCPLCKGTKFEWLEGTDDTDYGICKGCSVEVDFMYRRI
jgi:GGDEF domain-containing protein